MTATTETRGSNWSVALDISVHVCWFID